MLYGNISLSSLCVAEYNTPSLSRACSNLLGATGQVIVHGRRLESWCHGHLHLFHLGAGRVERIVPVCAPECQVALNSSFDLGGFVIWVLSTPLS